MTSDKYELLIVNLRASLPKTLTFSNLLGNENYKKWLLPRVEAIKEAQYWNQEKINLVTSTRLKNLLEHAKKHSPFWRNRFNAYSLNIKSSDILGELMKLPVVDKTHMIEWGDNVLVLSDEKPLIKYSTSGTTGVPLRIKFKETDIITNECLYFFEPNAFDLQLVEKVLSEKFILMLGRSILPQFSSFSEHFPIDSFSLLEKPEIRKQIYEKIRSNPITYLFAYSSVTFELMQYIREDKISLSLMINLSGEAVSYEEERFIYETTGGPLTFCYNCKEAGKIAGKCHANIGKSLYHIYRERALVEIVDGNGNTLKNGVDGNIVVTILDRFTTPIIRYSTGDKGKILLTSCSCGKASPLLEVSGRTKDIIVLPGGKIFNTLLFRSLFAKEIGLENIKKYQIVQKSIGELQINFVPRKKVNNERIKVVKIILENALKNDVTVDIREVEHIRGHDSGKDKVFISLEESKKKGPRERTQSH